MDNKTLILSALNEWIKENRKKDLYADALLMCEEIIEVFDDKMEMYCDEAIWNIIRKYIKFYEEANGEEFK